MRSILHASLALCASLTLAACGTSNSDSSTDAPLRIGMIPDAGATAASVADKQPLEDYLSAAIGREVELVIPTNYGATVEALGNGTLDIAYLGGLTFVKARERYGAEPLVQRKIDQQFHSVFIAAPASGIDSLDDLAGKRVCFGDVNSTSGNLMPRFELKQAGVDPARLGAVRNTGSHPATAQGVASGACDAGAMDETVYKDLVAKGELDPARAAVFFISAPFADYVWAARKDIAEADSAAFTKAMLALARGRDDAVLDILRGDEFTPASADSYANVEATARALGLL